MSVAAFSRVSKSFEIHKSTEKTLNKVLDMIIATARLSTLLQTRRYLCIGTHHHVEVSKKQLLNSLIK